MPEFDVLHDYRPDPTFTIASRLATGHGPAEDSTIPASAKKAAGLLGEFHVKFLWDNGESPPKPKTYDDNDRQPWKDLTPERKRQEIEKLTWEELVDNVNKQFEGRAYSEPGAADDPLPEYKDTRPYLGVMLKTSKTGWESIKEAFVATANSMGGFLSFRSNYVNGMIDALKKGGLEPDDEKKLDFVAKSVGSVDLTSDYDLTFGGADDVPAVYEFNRAFRAAWSREPGTVFDTNIYFRDWMIVKDQIPKSNAGGTDDSIQVGVLENIGDLYGLVKIRRYTSKAEWDAFANAVRRDVAVSGFDSAEDVPLFARLDLVDEIYQTQYVKPMLRRLADVHKRFENSEAGKALKQKGKNISKQTARTLERLVHHYPDEVLKVSNLAYVELGAKLRDDEAALKENDNYSGSFTWRQNKGKDLVDKETPFNLHGFTIFTERHSLLLSEAVIYAAEAYNTQGSLWTIVGGQGGEAPKNMTLSHYLQTFNEQVGDGLKELREHLRHTEGHEEILEEETHVGYYRASKYEGRMKQMVDSMVTILKDDPVVARRKEVHAELFPGTIGPDEDDLGLLSFEAVLADVYDEHVGKLLDIRKARNDHATTTPEEKQQAAKDLVDAVVKQGSQFSKMIRDGARLCAKVEYDPPNSKYTPEGGDGTFNWGLRHLIHHLLWHCALINKVVRKVQSRGPTDLVVRNFAKG